MLVLTRRRGEAVLIGEGMTVRVLKITDTQVQLGFDVPKNVNVIREELKEALEKSGKTVYADKGEKPE